jgi:hypothetical protein
MQGHYGNYQAMNPKLFDVDAELDAWWDGQAVEAANYAASNPHRCPMDMPPCPDCQAIQEEEDEREYGLQ